MNNPRVHKSQLLLDREHDTKMADSLLVKITKYSMNTFKAEPDAFVRLTIDTNDSKILVTIYSNNDYMEDMINNVKAAILSENITIDDEQFAVNGRYYIKINNNGAAD
jgi:hypothetical protein